MPTAIRAVLSVILALVALFVALFALWVMLLMISAIIISPKKVYSKNSKYHRFLLYASTFLAKIGTRTKLYVTGIENVPKEGRFLLVANHRSKFDPIFTWWVLRKFDIAYISKPENFKVFCFGRIIRKCCFLPINRQDPRDAIKTLTAAAELIKDDQVSIGIYPEGTRSKTLELLPFHDGTLKIAQMAKVPIVVLTTKGTEKVAKNFPLRGNKIYLDFVETIPADYVAENSTHTISARVRNDMERSLSK